MLKTLPAVFALGNEYQIMVPVTCETLMFVRVGNECFYDEINGIMRSDVLVHRMTVPRVLLDHEKKYTICVRKVIERKPYFTETEDIVEYTFNFRPVKDEKARAFHISDSHNSVIPPVSAAKAYGDIDFLILNGDIPNHSGNMENIFTVYEIISEITKGEIPVIFSRGNHDMRGNCATRFAEITPCQNGNTYYTFRLGSIWGMVLDCGEDKDDAHEAYGHTICCHVFRKRQTEFIKKIIENEESEYGADGIRYKIIICHNPFTQLLEKPFDIEQDIYKEWAKLLKDNIKPDVMLCGHLHKAAINEIGCAEDHLGQPCTVVVASEPISTEENPEDMVEFKGLGIMFENDGIRINFSSHDGKTEEEYIIK